LGGYLLSDYLHGDVSVYAGELVIGREELPNGCQYIILKDKQDTVLYEFFYNPKNPAKLRDEPPKHAGRKQSYVMLMLKGIKGLKCDNKLEIMGAIMALSDCVEWNTGMLIRKRPKRPIKPADFPVIFGMSRSKTYKLLGQMKDLEIIEKLENKFYITEKYIRKGKSKK
jgi:hypothetical protein